MRRVLVLLTIALGGCGSGPFSSKACTSRGCQDQLTLTIHDANGAVPAGAHRLEVTVDGRTATCSFTVPRAPSAPVTCAPGVRLELRPQQTCVTTTNGNATSQTCTPVPGKVDEVVVLDGKPATVRALQTLDGVTILDETATPAYESTRPNGPGCDPVCAQANVAWTMR